MQWICYTIVTLYICNAHRHTFLRVNWFTHSSLHSPAAATAAVAAAISYLEPILIIQPVQFAHIISNNCFNYYTTHIWMFNILPVQYTIYSVYIAAHVLDELCGSSKIGCLFARNSSTNQSRHPETVVIIKFELICMRKAFRAYAYIISLELHRGGRLLVIIIVCIMHFIPRSRLSYLCLCMSRSRHEQTVFIVDRTENQSMRSWIPNPNRSRRVIAAKNFEC